MQESAYDEAAASRADDPLCGDYGKGGDVMSDFEILMLVLGIIGSLISFGILQIALLNFLDTRNSKRK